MTLLNKTMGASSSLIKNRSTEIALKIVFVGAGNVAQHIARSFSGNKKINIVQVFNHRKTAQAKTFAQKLHTAFISDYKKLNTTADLYIISVKDDALAEVAKQLAQLHLTGIVAHTSGSIALSVLNNVSPQIGVYYPLQSFSKDGDINWKTTPLLIESNTKVAFDVLKDIANSVSDSVKKTDSITRLKLHLAAVFACNFTNALYAASFDFIEAHLSKKDTDLLKPIMLQSFLKLNTLSPKQAQTGPAMRNDNVVMNKHLALLKTNKQLTAVYKLVSALIMEQQKTN